MTDISISIADLRTRITLQSPSLSTDGGGFQRAGYSNVGTNPTVWAQWINDHGQESAGSNAETFVQRATLRLRHRADIQTTWRVLKDSEPWGILSIDLVRGQNRWIELRVEKVTSTIKAAA